MRGGAATAAAIGSHVLGTHGSQRRRRAGRQLAGRSNRRSATLTSSRQFAAAGVDGSDQMGLAPQRRRQALHREHAEPGQSAHGRQAGIFDLLGLDVWARLLPELPEIDAPITSRHGGTSSTGRQSALRLARHASAGGVTNVVTSTMASGRRTDRMRRPPHPVCANGPIARAAPCDANRCRREAAHAATLRSACRPRHRMKKKRRAERQ